MGRILITPLVSSNSSSETLQARTFQVSFIVVLDRKPIIFDIINIFYSILWYQIIIIFPFVTRTVLCNIISERTLEIAEQRTYHCTGPDPASLTSLRLKKEDTVLWLKSLLNPQMNRWKTEKYKKGTIIRKCRTYTGNCRATHTENCVPVFVTLCYLFLSTVTFM
jgi:hypothetical protein